MTCVAPMNQDCPKPDFYLDEHGHVQSRGGWWCCLKCRAHNRPASPKCYCCRYPKGWLADEEVMAKLGWVRVDVPVVVEVATCST